MATKYWRLKLKGKRSVDEIESAVGQSGGQLVRVHFEGGETRVYFAAKKSVAPKAAKSMRGAGIPEAVSSREVKSVR